MVVRRRTESLKALGGALSLAAVFVLGKAGAILMEPSYRPVSSRPTAGATDVEPVLGSAAPSFASGLTHGTGALVVFGDCDSCAVVTADVLSRIRSGLSIVAVRPSPSDGKGKGDETHGGYTVRELPAREVAPLHAIFTPRIYRYRDGRLVSIQPSFLNADAFVQELDR